MKEITDVVERIIQEEAKRNAKRAHERTIVIERPEFSPDSYMVGVEAFFGLDRDEAVTHNHKIRYPLTFTGYEHRRTLRKPRTREYVVHCGQDDVARATSRETADFIAYSIAREEGKQIAERAGYRFEDRTGR